MRGTSGGRTWGGRHRGWGHIYSPSLANPPSWQPHYAYSCSSEPAKLLLKTYHVTKRTESSMNICHLASILLVATGTCKDGRILNTSTESVGKIFTFLIPQP